MDDLRGRISMDDAETLCLRAQELRVLRGASPAGGVIGMLTAVPFRGLRRVDNCIVLLADRRP